MSFIYVSYSPDDRIIAEAIGHMLEQKGVKCWLPTRDIQLGQSPIEAMISAIEKCHAVIVIFSSNSSQQVLRDVGKAKEKDKPIVTLKIEDDSLSKHLEYYLSSPYTLDISKISLNEAIDQLEKLLKNIVLPSEFNPSNLTDSTLSKISKSESIIPGITMPEPISLEQIIPELTMPEQSISKPTISEPTTSEPAIPSNQVYSTNTAPSSSPAYTDEYTKTARKFFKWLPRGFRLFMLALIWLAHINTSTDDIDFTNTSTVNYTQSYSTAIKNVVDKNGIHFSYFKEDMLNSSRFTEEEIIEFAKTTVIELEQSEVRSFKKAAIMGKNEKPHGIEYLVKLDYICDRDYEKEGINQGEATLYTNAIIIETKEGELKYLAVKEISEEDLNQKNEKIEKEALESVKEIVKQNNSKVAAVLVDTAEGTSQGSGFFIADGFIVTNYHVIKGGTNAIVRLSDTSTLAVEGIVCADAHLDLAVLKLKEQIGIEPVTLGGINEFEKDEWAVAINSPSGLFNDVSSCIISNTWTNKGIHLLQISIPMTYGNSGVALFNKNGKVVGVTSSGMCEADLNFAVSAEHLIPIQNQLTKIDFNQLEIYTFSELPDAIAVAENAYQVSQEKYRFVRSEQPIGKNLTYTTDIDGIEELGDGQFGLNFVTQRAELTLSLLINPLGLSSYEENYKDPKKLNISFHETYVREDLEYYIGLSKKVESANDHYNNPYISYKVKNVKLAEAALNQEGKLDGIVIDADIVKYADDILDYTEHRKYYFRYSEESSAFRYVGEIQ